MLPMSVPLAIGGRRPVLLTDIGWNRAVEVLISLTLWGWRLPVVIVVMIVLMITPGPSEDAVVVTAGLEAAGSTVMVYISVELQGMVTIDEL
ncbi:uncharacterized protein F4807DRAFT_416202, partial [Annulohypoxylon truncatum]|uniref:uncharacterized protein n=1 Tax=Annulohypoxylon truncatum TaxID=327061 RepID=UPI002008AB39